MQMALDADTHVDLRLLAQAVGDHVWGPKPQSFVLSAE